MAYCRLEDTFRDSRKFTRLGERLDIDPALARGLVAGLWSWAIRMAPDGDLRDFEIKEIEIAAGWRGAPGALVEAMAEPWIRLLDQSDDGGFSLHGYLKRAQSYREAQRKADTRAKAAKGSPGHVPDTSETVPEKSTREEGRGEEKEERSARAAYGSRTDSDEIATLGDLEAALSQAGLAVTVSAPARSAFASLCPIPPHEWATAVERTKRRRPGDAASYALGVVKGIREDALEAARDPKLPQSERPTQQGAAYQPFEVPHVD